MDQLQLPPERTPAGTGSLALCPDRSPTSDLSVQRTTVNQLGHTGQGRKQFLWKTLLGFRGAGLEAPAPGGAEGGAGPKAGLPALGWGEPVSPELVHRRGLGAGQPGARGLDKRRRKAELR